MYSTVCILTSQVPNFVAHIHHKDLVTYAATTPDQPNRCNLIYCFNIVTLARSYSALHDDGDYADTCWSWFNVNFNKAFKDAFASVGVKKSDNFKVDGTTVGKRNRHKFCYKLSFTRR